MELWIVLVFVLGYAAIAFEHWIKINKAASALIAAIFCWAIYILSVPQSNTSIDGVLGQLIAHLGDISSILVFLLGAMTIVELVDLHNGFQIVTSKIKATSKRRLLWIVSILTFLLSSVLDNLTTTIVLISLLRKLVSDKNDRLLFASMVVIAANAGGAWTVIGDVTTTMLWIGKQISTVNIMLHMFIPSVICLVVPLTAVSFTLKGNVATPEKALVPDSRKISTRRSNTVFFIGIGALLFVPIFKSITHLHPFMGILLGMSLLWIYTELSYRNESQDFREHFGITHALRRVELSSILFFLGILLCIACLESTEILRHTAEWLDKTVHNQNMIVMTIGLASAIIDNVPLVAAAQGMYSFPMDHYFWLFLAYCAGTGGSILIIGSAAGVAAMGMEKINFMWYLKKISFYALLGYFAGAFAYIGLSMLF